MVFEHLAAMTFFFFSYPLYFNSLFTWIFILSVGALNSIRKVAVSGAFPGV